MKISIKNKIFLLIATFVGAVVFILLSSIFLLEKSNVQNLSIENLEKEKDERVAFFDNYINTKTTLLRSIIENKYVVEFSQKGTNKDYVENIFITLAKVNKEIFQFRYIDINGNEIIRVDNYNKEVLVNEDKLQNKKGRYYFEDTLKKKNSEIYYSNIDLNMEEGRIELPIVPTLRIAKTLVVNNQKMGIVILNINLKVFLDHLKKSSLHHINLIYDDGNIILTQNPNFNWTRDFKIDKNIFYLFGFLPRDYNASKHIENKNFFLTQLTIKSKNKIYMLLLPKKFDKYNELYVKNINRICLLIFIALLGLPFGYLIAGYIEHKYEQKILLEKTTTDNILINSVINSTNDLIFYKDKDFKYLGCNHAFERFVGKNRLEIIGKCDFELFDDEHAQLFRDMDLLMLKDNKVRVNHEWVIYPDNSKIYLQTQKIPFNYNLENNIGILGLCRDNTDLHLSQVKIKEQTYIDELTQAFNRKLYNERIQESFDLYDRYNETFCIAIYDIDNFKNINDTYGHNIGDKVLIEMTLAVQKLIRKTDLLFRIGGEEFILLLPKNKVEDAFIFIEKVRKHIESLEFLENEKITVSIGLTEVRKEDTVCSLFKRADVLMYESKNNGKNMTNRC